MHAKPDLRVRISNWIIRSGSVITDVIWLNDMNRHILIVPALIIVFVWLTWYGAVASAGSSFAHKTNAIFFFLASIGLILASTVSAIALWRKTNTYRTYSILILALSGMMLIGSVWYRTNQHSYVINELESAYNSIAANGSPFPALDEIQQGYLNSLPESYSTGYWVSSDQQSFEIYYHDSSDSYTMQYPNGEWDWRGNGYTGPQSAR